MDWRNIWIWCLCFMVLSPLTLCKEITEKHTQERTDASSKENPEPSESKVVFVTKDVSETDAFHEDSSNNSNVQKENYPAAQIEKPKVVIKKTRRLLKASRRDGKLLKIQNTTSEGLNKLPSKESVPVPDTSDPSVSEESFRIEEFSSRPEDIAESESREDGSNEEPRFAQAHFVPSEDFPKKLASHTRKDSSKRNEEARYLLSVQPDSSEETSRSDSRERFESKRQRKPSTSFNRAFATDTTRHSLEDDLRQSQRNNHFPEAQKVTIVKEKTIHSTSTAEEQERVNIQKKPLRNQATNDIFLQQQPRTFQSPQQLGNIEHENVNRQEEKLLLIEGTHIPGRNYGPTDDTFGFYSEAYKEDKAPDNRRKVKVVKVVKNKQEERIPPQAQVNNHGNGQSKQYFINEQNAQPVANFNHPPLNKQFGGDGQGTALHNVPQPQQNNQNRFVPNHLNVNDHPIKGFNQPPIKNQFGDSGQGHTFQATPQIQQNHQNHFVPNNLNLNDHPTKGLNQPPINNQFGAGRQGHSFQTTSQLQQNNQNHFEPSQLNVNAKQATQVPFQQNLNFDNIPHQNNLQVGSTHSGGNTVSHQQGGEEHLVLDIIPNPNELYIDENTGQLIKFVVADDANQNSHPTVAGGNLIDQKSSQNFFSQTHQQPNVNVGEKLHQKVNNQFQLLNAGSISGAHDMKHQLSQNGYSNQQHGQQDNIMYIHISPENAAHFTTAAREQGNYQTSDNQYQQGGGVSNPKGDSPEYVLPCDQETQDYSGQNVGGNNHQQANFASHNQYQDQAVSSGINHNKGQTFNSGNQGGYDFNAGNQKQSFENRLHDQGLQGNNKGHGQSTIYSQGQGHNFKVSNLVHGNNKGIGNAGIPQLNTIPQGHYKGSDFSNNKGDNNFPAQHINIGAQGQYKGNELSNNKGSSFQINVGGQSNYKGSKISNNKGTPNFPPPQLNLGGQGNYKGSENLNNKGVTNFATPPTIVQSQGHYKGTEFSNNNKGDSNYGISQINPGAQGHYKGSEFSNNQGSNNYVPQHINTGSQGHFKGTEFSNNQGSNNYGGQQINAGAQGQYKGSEFSNNQGGENYGGQQINAGAQGHYKGSEFSNNQGGNNYGGQTINAGAQGHYINNNKGDTNFPTPQTNIIPQGHFKGTEFDGNNGGSHYGAQQINLGGQGHIKGTEFAGNKGGNNYGAQQINLAGQGDYKGTQFSGNAADNYGTAQINAGAQGHYKGSDFTNNKGVTNFATPQTNIAAQGHFKGDNNNYAIPQINSGLQGHYKGSEFSTNKGNSYATQQINAGAQGQYKGSDFSVNGGGGNYAIQQVNTGSQGNFKGSELSNNKGATHFNTPATNIGVQGNYKGSAFSNNKGSGDSYAIPQVSLGGGGNQYQGGGFSNSKGDTNLIIPQFNAGVQGQYKGSEFSGNKGVTNFATPQTNIGGQGNYKGSDFSNNRGDTNYAIPQQNSGAQGHFKGSEYTNNKGITNFQAPQLNIGAQGHFKGTEFSNNKGDTHTAIPQINAGGQGQYKGSGFSNAKQNSNMPVYKENVTPTYTAGGDLSSLLGNNDGALYVIQNQGNFKGDISEGNYDSGSGPNNQKGYDAGNGAFLNNQGYGGGSSNKGTQFPAIQDQKGYGGGSELLHNQGYSGESNNKGSQFPVIQNQKGYGGGSQEILLNNQGYGGGSSNKGTQFPAIQDQKGYGGGSELLHNQGYSGGSNNKGSQFPAIQNQKGYDGGSEGIVLNNKGSQFPVQAGYSTGSEFSNNKGGYDGGQDIHIAINAQNKGSGSSNQKGYNSGAGLFSEIDLAQGNNKGSQFSNAKGYNSGSGGQYNNQRNNLGTQLKGSGIGNQKGYNTRGNSGNGRLNFGSQKGYNANRNRNFGGDNYGQGLSSGKGQNLNQRGQNKGRNLFSGGIPSNAYSNNNQFSGQKGYVGGNEAFTSTQNYNAGEQGDLLQLIQKGYNAESDIFNSNNARGLFSGILGPTSSNKGSGFVNQNRYNSGNNKGQRGNQGYQIDSKLLSDVLSQEGLNTGSGYSNNKGQLSGNQGYPQVSISQSYSGSFAPKGKRSNNFNQNNSGKQSFQGMNRFIGTDGDLFKGRPIHVPQNNGYGSQKSGGSANNNFKGTNFRQNGGNSDYRTNSAAGYRGGNSMNAQQIKSGGGQYGVSYSSSEEIPRQQGQQYSENSSEQDPVQLIIVEEDIPGLKNGNDVLYYLQNNGQHHGGNNQEESYLILDDSTVLKQPNLKVMVDGGKDKTFPLRQLATVGLHMARTVLPQLKKPQKPQKPQKPKQKSFSGSITFGVEIKKNSDKSDDSRPYLQYRNDEGDEQTTDITRPYLESRSDKPDDVIADGSHPQIESRSDKDDQQTTDSSQPYLESPIDKKEQITTENTEKPKIEK